RVSQAPPPNVMIEAKTKSPDSVTAISIVVPLLNERPTLDALHERLTRTLAPLAVAYEIIFVDDGSTDGSLERIKAMAAADAHVRYVRFRRNFGKSAALAAGFRHARYGVIATLDADLQDQPEQLVLLIDKLREGYDLVAGWRYHRQDKLTRRLASLIYNRATGVLT